MWMDQNMTARQSKYADEIARLYAMHADSRLRIAQAVMAVADGEQAELRAEILSLHGRLFDSERTITELAGRVDRRDAKIQRVEELRDECAGQHGQCWNSIFARRIDAALK